MLEKFKPTDIIAIIIIIGCFCLIATECGSVAVPILLAVVGFYFGLKSTEPGNTPKV
jgi:hypothetical protein